MDKAPPETVARFNATIKEAEVLLNIARASELQQAACDVLERQAIELDRQKASAVDDSDEDLANLYLGCQQVNQCVLAEMRMWLLLKRELPEDAWDQLVLAQDCAIAAVRAHPGFAHLSEQYQRLEIIEHLVFPPQVFLSSGFLARKQECSICASEYGECDHLIGRPYMGRLCHVIAKDLTYDHLAIVDVPADKRCRVQTFSTDGGNRNRMTWRVTASNAGGGGGADVGGQTRNVSNTPDGPETDGGI